MKTWFANDTTASERDFLIPVLRGEMPVAAEMVSERILRRVFRVELPTGRSVYVKQHLFPFLRARLRYALRASPTARELSVLRVASDRGLTVPVPVAEATDRAWLGPRRSTLVTLALPPGRPVTPAELVDAASLLADRGLFHPDLHGDNVQRIRDGFAFVDFQSSRARARVTAGQRRRMIAKALLDLRREGGAAACAGILADRGLPDHADILPRIERLLDREAASRDRHRLRASTRVVRQRKGLLGLRLCRRGVPVPASFGPERPFAHPVTGACLAATSLDGACFRLRRPGRLREIWRRVPDRFFTATDGILAWERDGPWPWAMQSLYIPNHMGSSDLGRSLDVLLEHDDARTDSPADEGSATFEE